jgi:hypothetical protein
LKKHSENAKITVQLENSLEMHHENTFTNRTAPYGFQCQKIGGVPRHVQTHLTDPDGNARCFENET